PSTPQPSSGAVLATPAIRKLAKDLGVDLSKVKGTGPEGRVTEEDLKKTGSSVSHPAGAIPKLGPEERLPLQGVRKAIAQRLQMSKHYAPHYTYVEEVDVTDLMALREKMKSDAEKQGVKLTYLAFFVKALIPALKAFPYLNASLDETTQEVVLKKYYNLGVAVATSDGLIVPVIKDVDKKKLFDVAKEIVVLSEKVKAHKATPDDLKGSTFTVTSIGSIGGVFATPIINYPDVAILGINKIVERPVVKDGKIVPRQMLYLSLTLDHRVVDGAVAAEFMNKLIEVLQDLKVIL
ncbi:MAG: 2-oxo acid dehydrogenase subunit E2, partial [Deltaproteobacteria bacterium]|nr:2-oxo acid dehydrogenase subunit E2 [Deltaproteobacteria bacterium]